MLHPMTLPPIAEKALGNAVRVQIGLFLFAATEVLDQTSAAQRGRCSAFLDGRPGLSGSGQSISVWFWGQRSLFTRLANFSSGDPTEKQAWAASAAQDMDLLFTAGAGQLASAQAKELHPLDPLPKVTKKTPATWKHDGVDYLIGWYSLFRSRALPGEVTGGSPFSGQTFLREYDQQNRLHHVCPACDEESWATRIHNPKRGVSGKAYIADVDHFFPKSVYPQFAVHPHNLVPICKVCNSGLKLDEDPLSDAGVRRPVDHAPAPYWTKALRTETYLRFGATPQDPLVLTRFDQSVIPTERVNILAKLYRIPERWSEHYQRDDTFYFQQVVQWVCRRRELRQNGLTAAELHSDLKEYLSDLEHWQGRQPRMFPLYWWVQREVERLEDVQPDSATTGTNLLDVINRMLKSKPALPRVMSNYPLPRLG